MAAKISFQSNLEFIDWDRGTCCTAEWPHCPFAILCCHLANLLPTVFKHFFEENYHLAYRVVMLLSILGNLQASQMHYQYRLIRFC